MYKIKKMQEDVHTTLQGSLSSLEGLQNSPDDSIYTNKSHIILLKNINSLLGEGDEITSEDAQRVLRVCLQNEMNMQLAPYTLSIISTLLSINKEKPFTPSVDFLPSSLAVLGFLTKCAEVKTNSIRTLTYQVLMAHPVSTLVNLVRNHSAILFETFKQFYAVDIGYSDNKIESFILLQFLKVLPTPEKSLFVKEGIPMWFNHMLPCLMQVLVSVEENEKAVTCLSYAELLAEELVLHDYFDYPEWQRFLLNIVDPKKYSLCIKSMLDKGKDTWYRIWILFIKLLKGHVTKFVGTYGTPINSLLPAVEAAFKMDSIQRVRAFACWDELIKNFSNEINSNETSAHCIVKRLKLVVIPLKLNNAKTEQAVIAKFNTWWLLIQRYKPKLGKFANEILIPFLHFLFGKRQLSKHTIWAGKVSNDMRQRCLEAFVEIVGHSECDGCTTVIEPLNGKVITTVMLADYWNDWIFSLKTAVIVVALNSTYSARKKLRCLWKSFILLMTELLDNSVRRDWLNDVVNQLLLLAQESDVYNDLIEIMMEDLTLPLFEDPNIHTLLSSKSQDHRPMHEIVTITTGKMFDSFYKRYNPDELQKLLEPLITALLNESKTSSGYMLLLLEELPLTESSFKLWTALARKATESDLCLQVLMSLLQWPLKAVLAMNDVKDAALAWYTLYNTVHVKLDKIGFDNEISKLLIKPVEDSKSANYFILFALIGVLKYNPNEDKMAKLEALTYEMNDYEEFEPLIPALVDTLALMIDNSSEKKYENLAQITMNCISNVLKVINSETKSKLNSPSVSRETAFSDARTNLSSINKTVLIDTITTAMKKFLAKSTNDSIKKEVKDVISSLEKGDNKSTVKSPVKADIVPKEFTSPKVLDIKKTKKKEPSIVTTVMENGEEYVVVKSHWKFNPKNLTENQKEKLLRKRDIPALYQDLSQSQDEFKLSTWKTDSNSQDTSLSSSKSSKSASNNDAAEVLKNMPSSDVVPKIMENILDNAKNTPQKPDVTSPVTVDKVIKVDKITTPQSTKSPRMALKDRVFRNVRNLIEKSSPPRTKVKNKDIPVLDNASVTPILKPTNEITEMKDDLNQIEAPKSPVSKLTEENVAANKQENQSPVSIPPERIMDKVIIVTAKQNKQNITLVCTPISKARTDNNITNSAPLPTAERPARMKRKPKKFDDSLLLAFKKRRHSIAESQDSQELQDDEPEVTVAQVHTPKDKSEKTDNDHKTKMIEANKIDAITTKEDDKARKTDNVILLSDNIVHCDTPKHQEIVETHNNDNVVTPTTPISNKSTEKSPEKPTTSVEVPTDKDKASEGIEKDSAKKLLEESKEVPKLLKTPRELKDVQQKSSVKRKQDIITTRLIKTRKAKLQIAALMTPVTTTIDLDEKAMLTKTSDVELENKKENIKMDVVSTPVNKTCKSKDGQLKSTKKNIAQKETIENEKFESVTLIDKTKAVNTPLPEETSKKVTKENESTNDKVTVTPNKNQKHSDPKLSVTKPKKSRIEKELMIDMVEGHPFLKSQSEKRLTRKKIMVAENSDRRKSLAEKLKSKFDATPKTSKKPKDKKASPTNTITVKESQDKQNNSDVTMDEPPCSEDIIESSQDSTMTTISVKSTKRTTKRQPVISLERVDLEATETQELIQDNEMNVLNFETTKKTVTSNLKSLELSPARQLVVALKRVDVSPKTQEVIQNSEVNVPNETLDKTDIELSQNKTAEVDKNATDLTENMDTEPMGDKETSDDVIILDETEPTPITINSEPIIGPETQELADADTQPNDPEQLAKFEEISVASKPPISRIEIESVEATDINIDKTNEVSSPYKDDTVRKQDFLNNTLEISPIKVQSPDREKKSPSPETSSDFVVIKLSSPVHSNGEPFEKHGSPEFFSEDKVSPDKRDASPPRAEVTVTNTSPSSSLSLKKNRPQVRPTGRAAQMLDLLCVHSDLKVTKVPERIESEEVKKSANTPARRNLRILYNSVGDVGDCEMPEQNVEETDNFLKLKRSLPTVTSSPSGPILKRKLVDIADEATTSPASKRKRVSFHDPPVSTTMSVHKYIEPLSMVRSPQSSAKKRIERQTRTGLKSPKRLENAFNLDSVLSKTVESFTETPDETQSTLDVTPIVEIVKASELNDTDPFYPDLIDCKEPIQVIATELSSPAMSELFVKELEGKIETIGDLAKMTELEVNRLCIKAPKIQVARKVLTAYAKKQDKELVETVIEEAFSEPMTVSLLDKTVSVEMQTDAVEISSTEIQTDAAMVILASTQTDSIVTAQTSVQTDDSNTEDIISTCLNKKEDFVAKLTEKLDEESIRTIAETLPPKSLFDLLIKKSDDTTSVCNRLLKLHSKGLSKDKKSSAELSFVQDVLCKRYESRDLILLCSQLLQKIHDTAEKPA